MRYGVFLLLLIGFMLTACDSENAEAETDLATYGEPIESTQVLPVHAVLAEPEQYADRRVAVEGFIRETCQSQGCWMTLRGEREDASLLVRVPETEDGEYVFTIPTGSQGLATVEGLLTLDDAASDADLELTAQGVRIEPTTF